MPRKTLHHGKKIHKDVVGNPTGYEQYASVRHGASPPPGEGWKYLEMWTDGSGNQWDKYSRKLDMGSSIKEAARKDAAYEAARKGASGGAGENY